jgi:hypothetical protein
MYNGLASHIAETTMTQGLEAKNPRGKRVGRRQACINAERAGQKINDRSERRKSRPMLGGFQILDKYFNSWFIWLVNF